MKVKNNRLNLSSNISDILRLAINHQQNGELQLAKELYHEILLIDKDNADALHLLGLIALREGKNQEALTLIERSIAANKIVPVFHFNAGEAYRTLNSFEKAIGCYRRALALKPDFCEAYNSLGMALERQGDLEAAIKCYRDTLSLRSDSPIIYYNLGIAFEKQSNLEEAIVSFRRALSLKPDYHEAYTNLGTALQKQGKLEEAIECYRQAVCLKPDFYAALNNLGVALQEQGRIEEAIECYCRALFLKPEWPEAHVNLSVIYLLRGNFKEGWKEYQYRIMKWDISRYLSPFNSDVTKQYWDGSDVKGKTILLWTEQGLGDVIHFMRYIPLVLEKSGKIVVECQKELVPLLRSISGIREVVERGQPLPDFDFHAPLLTLPFIFDTTLETIPAAVPYITADPQKVSMWRERLLCNSDKLKIGLCWAGSPGHRNDRNRSLSLSMFSILGEMKNAIFYSLQKADVAAQIENPPEGLNLVDYTDELNDFSDTAALIENLDLVITVDTAVAHLAGALGKPVWILLPFVPDWRWMLDRVDSPWYPAMRLYRQPSHGDWDSVLKMIRQAMNCFAPPPTWR